MRDVLNLIGETIVLVDKLVYKMREIEMSAARKAYIETLNNKPTVNLPYKDYLKLLELVAECAMILDKNQPLKFHHPDSTIQVKDVDFVPEVFEFDELESPEANRQMLDNILESDQAFNDLNAALGLN